MKRKKHQPYFTAFEKWLWAISVLCVGITYFMPGGGDLTSTLASLVGVSSLLFLAKGNPFGQILMIVFSVQYGIVSFRCAYYGELITYICMTLPMSVLALIAWLGNPYNGNRAEVKVNRITKTEWGFALLLTAAVTVGLHFVLRAFGTAELTVSTVSIATSFIAAYLTFRRSPYYAFAYALNDLVLIILWTLQTLRELTYLSVTVCFAVFFVNDMYGFICWLKMEKKQTGSVAK